jgi:hypothetical protein
MLNPTIRCRWQKVTRQPAVAGVTIQSMPRTRLPLKSTDSSSDSCCSSASHHNVRAQSAPLGRERRNHLPHYLALAVLGAGGGEQGAAQSARTLPAFESPFTYCARVGTDDRLGGEGGAASSAALRALAPSLPEALGLPREASLSPHELFWRCMNGKVYVCARGANIPCDSKADRARLNRGAANYCRENPNAADVPAYATGHRTVYLWKCAAGLAERGPKVGATDPRGFRTDFWHLVVR